MGNKKDLEKVIFQGFIIFLFLSQPDLESRIMFCLMISYALEQCFLTRGVTTFGLWVLTFGFPKPMLYSNRSVLYWVPNCVLLYFVGRQLPNVENHCSTELHLFIKGTK